MGKIEVRGYAERKVNYDGMVIDIEFNASSKAGDKASKQVLEQCEEFLGLLEKQGFDISEVQLLEDSVEEERYRSENQYCASRGITLKMKFDMVVVNLIRKMLNNMRAEVCFDVKYYLINSKELHEELLKEALLNAKHKAEVIAETLNQKIVKLVLADKKSWRYDTMDDESDDDFDEDECIGARALPVTLPDFLKSNQLKSKETMETEEISTIWEIE